MKNDYKDFDGILLVGVPKGQGLHGLTPEPLPVAQLAPKDNFVQFKTTQPIVKIGIAAGMGFLFAHILKNLKL